jgi:hypothetical protein
MDEKGMAMDPAAFTCILVELAKLENVEVVSDISKKIYEIYEGNYENYTLFELIEILWAAGIHDCPFNKKAIIERIERDKLDIPKKFKPEPSEWHHYRIRRSLNVLVTPIFEIYEGCIIELKDGSVWGIEVCSQRSLQKDATAAEGCGRQYEDVVFIGLDGMYEKSDSQFDMDAAEFMHMLDHDDVTLLQIRDLNYFMSDSEREYWTDYTRMI